MNLSARYIVAFTLLFFGMISWNAFLVVRDNKMFEGYKKHQAQICQEMKSFHPDCHIE
jgi:hypothetical protein